MPEDVRQYPQQDLFVCPVYPSSFFVCFLFICFLSALDSLFVFVIDLFSLFFAFIALADRFSLRYSFQIEWKIKLRFSLLLLFSFFFVARDFSVPFYFLLSFLSVLFLFLSLQAMRLRSDLIRKQISEFSKKNSKKLVEIEKLSC